ncbi:hypothetical protein EVB55_170 [Rhizobium phage RHph_Y68]|uniref:Uncharacterized protein n=1 Tax=Rhizobium phage RHph_Y68 TaxID=2509787 RepID=A0A7S5QYD1_9CAUD|nr:hypothetical protein PP934_gp170 [Rhizobium phage RHph_Y68]QIG68105.1 hypothetical protein EVB55_170 [Rhizobium phage RHph_Y68]
MHFRPLIDENTKKLYGEDNVFLVTNNPSKGSHYHSSLTAIRSERGAKVAQAFYERKGHDVLYRLNVKWKFPPDADVKEFVRVRDLGANDVFSGVNLLSYRQTGYRFWGYVRDKDYVWDMKSGQKHGIRNVVPVEEEVA